MSANNEVAMANLYDGLSVPIDSRVCGYSSSSNGRNSCDYVENPVRSPASGNRPIQDVVAEDEKDVFYSCIPENTENTVAFFQQVDDVIRERVDMEIDTLRENIHKILCDQQMQFQEAFALPDSLTSSSESMHVVPQSAYIEDTSSEEHQMIGESSSDSDYISVSEWNSCLYQSNCSNVSSPAKYSDGGDISNSNDVRILSYLVRLLTASSVISNTLRRKEYAT